MTDSFSNPLAEEISDEDFSEKFICQREGCGILTNGEPFCEEHSALFAGLDSEVVIDPDDVVCHYNNCENLSLFGEIRCIDHRFTGVLDLRAHTYARCEWFEGDDYCGRDADIKVFPEDPWRCDEHVFERPVEPTKDFEMCTYPGCTLHGDRVIDGVRWCVSHLPSNDNPALFSDPAPAPAVYSANGIYIAWYTADPVQVLDALKVELGRVHDEESDDHKKSELGKTLFILSEAQATLRASRQK